MRQLSKWLRSLPQKELSELDSWTVATLGVVSYAEASFFGWVVTESFPPYWAIARTLPISQWGLQGLVCSLLLMGTLTQVWIYSVVAKQCSSLLEHRLFA